MTTSINSIDSLTSSISVGGVEAFRFTSAGIISGALTGFRNKIINGGFTINQRAVTGTVTLAAGIYGHDRFKAGAGGCTYTFVSSGNGNVLTITAGTLLQVIEGANLEGGAMRLSWVGTAQGRIDTGTYSASVALGTAVGGTNQTVEFGVGTVGKVQYELGTVSTTFEQRFIGVELMLSQRYFTKIGGDTGDIYCASYITSSGILSTPITLPVTMRAVPTATVFGSWTVVNVTQPSINSVGRSVVTLYAGGTVVGQGVVQSTGSSTYITFNAEL